MVISLITRDMIWGLKKGEENTGFRNNLYIDKLSKFVY